MSKDTLLGLKNVPILACVVRGNWNYDDIDNIEFKVQSIGCVRNHEVWKSELHFPAQVSFNVIGSDWPRKTTV